MKITEAKKIYFVGIGGIGVSAIAKFLRAQGKEISGSNDVESEITEGLIKQGITVQIGHRLDNFSLDTDLLIFSAAVPADNPELKAAAEAGVKKLNYYEALAEISSAKKTVAISGTHGKTTTTSLAGLTLVEAGLDPTVIVGGQVKLFDGNLRVGSSNLFVTEACEYRRHFLMLKPEIIILTNLEADHLDYYKNLNEIKEAFEKFVLSVPGRGFVIYNADDKNLTEICRNVRANKLTYALKNTDADFLAQNVEYGRDFTSYSVVGAGEETGVTLRVAGEHNVYNSLSLFPLAHALAVDFSVVQKVLSSFEGTWRRLQLVGEYRGIPVYDDYAHHPTEIKATLSALKQKFPDSRVWLVFQPHLYSRTRQLMAGFVEALSQADEVILADIYAAREQPDGLTSQQMLTKLKVQNSNAKYFSSFEKIAGYLNQNVKEGDVVIAMGAGDIRKVAKMLVE